MNSVFRYCNYWGTWSRRIWAKSGYYIEMSLIPIPSCGSDSWTEVAKEKMRFHCTPRKPEEYLGPKLPAEVKAAMVKNLGEELTNRMLTHDYLAEFTAEQIKRANRASSGGGVPCVKIQAGV